MSGKISADQKKAYCNSVKNSNYQASLRLEGFDVELPETTQPEIIDKEEETDD